jgi:hypothetical protein
LGNTVGVPFLYDIDAHARFLIALPLLIFAELVVYQRMRTVVAQFVTLGLIRDAVRERFDAAIASAMRLRNSIAAEVMLILMFLKVPVLTRVVCAIPPTANADQMSACAWHLGRIMRRFQIRLRCEKAGS